MTQDPSPPDTRFSPPGDPRRRRPETRPQSNEPTKVTEVHNHTHNHTQHTHTIDTSAFARALENFVRSVNGCAFPQVVVMCRGERVAYGRDTLKNMGLSGAADVFTRRFATDADYTYPPPEAQKKGWFGWSQGRKLPAVTLYARFCKSEGLIDDGRRMELAAGGSWSELMSNISELEVILTRSTADM
ncbi:hypothetical protein HMN09_01187200 [Mycena chlorophos]|uniref:Uncharacterized protein n=1 Tax=Mycena chlorophos TaxID=658473 RepID=A0A8H6VU08_MYCCL|nr:hypothetical protein HMN09_01187200 [Mycena chlorophos]